MTIIQMRSGSCFSLMHYTLQCCQFIEIRWLKIKIRGNSNL